MSDQPEIRSQTPAARRLSALQGDITKIAVAAIVNAANNTLLGGGGVDGAIHRAAGPSLLEECRGLGGCATGDAKITDAYQLPSRYVIHTVGPVWHDGSRGEAGLLRNCYKNSLILAEKHRCKNIAFPCISTGVYRYPADMAAAVAVDTCKEVIAASQFSGDVVFVCFSERDFKIYEQLLSQFA